MEKNTPNAFSKRATNGGGNRPVPIGMRLSAIVSIFLIGLLLGGCCSPRFAREWRAASGDPARRWQGRWESQRPGVGGRLRAVVSEQADGHVRTYFEARWKCFVSAYPVSLEAKTIRGVTHLRGSHFLKSCVGGGNYTYRGTLKPDAFRAEYESHHDSGVFLLEPFRDCCPPGSR